MADDEAYERANPPPPEDSLHWYALNYRTAVHAHAAWLELEAYVEKLLAAEREKNKGAN